jgi:hypothetical protein
MTLHCPFKPQAPCNSRLQKPGFTSLGPTCSPNRKGPTQGAAGARLSAYNLKPIMDVTYFGLLRVMTSHRHCKNKPVSASRRFPFKSPKYCPSASTFGQAASEMAADLETWKSLFWRRVGGPLFSRGLQYGEPQWSKILI